MIDGLSNYDAELVNRLARLSPGADYSQAELVAAQQRLTDSGYFDSAFITLDTAASADLAPLLVSLREAKRQKLVLGVGASTDYGARLSASHAPESTWHRLARGEQITASTRRQFHWFGVDFAA